MFLCFDRLPVFITNWILAHLSAKLSHYALYFAILDKDEDDDIGSDEDRSFLPVGNEDAQAQTQYASSGDEEEDPQENSQRRNSSRSDRSSFSGYRHGSSSRTYREHLAERVLTERANSVHHHQHRRQQPKGIMPVTTRKKQSSEARAKAQQGKKTAGKTNTNALSEAEKTVKLQANELKILELQKKLAELTGKQGGDQNSMAQVNQNDGPPPLQPPAPASKKKVKLVAQKYDIPVSSELIAHILAIVKQEIWRTCKFISNDKQLLQVCRQIMECSEELSQYVAEGVEKEVQEAYIASLAQNFGEKICGAINTLRTTVQANLRKAYVERAMAGLPMPTPAQLLHVVKRKDLVMDDDKPAEGQSQADFDKKKAEVDQNMAWFLWYWDKLLVADAGKDYWSGSIRHYGTISGYAPLEDPTNKYITNSTEAMIVLIFENCAQRFPFCVECMQKKVKVDQTDAKFQAKWSNLQSGSDPFGGWEYGARTRFITLRDKIRIAKSRAHVQEVEEYALKLLREGHNLKEKKAAKTEKTAPSFAGKEKELEDFMEDLTEEVAVAEDDSSDIEEIDDVFLPPPKKKAKPQG